MEQSLYVQAHKYWVSPLSFEVFWCPPAERRCRFSAGDVRLSRLPGWEKHSWGYHADDGWSFPGHKDGNPYGPTFDSELSHEPKLSVPFLNGIHLFRPAGDIVGCGIDFSQHRAFYTKNGSLLGMLSPSI